MDVATRLSPLREEDYSGCLMRYFEASDYAQRQVGFVLPPTLDDLKNLFPLSATYKLIYKSASSSDIHGVVRIMSRPGKTGPRISVKFALDDSQLIKSVHPLIKTLAKTERKLTIVAYNIYGYEEEKIETLFDLGYVQGASTANTACLEGQYYDTLYLYYDLEKEYEISPRLKYAAQGDLYPIVPVEKMRQPLKLSFRMATAEDGADLAESISHQNTFRTLGMGVYQGFMTKNESAAFIEQGKRSGQNHAIVCVDSERGKVIGMSDVGIMPGHVSSHTGHVGIHINAQYQGMGAGTALLGEIGTLAKRLHLQSLVLSYFENNEVGKRLYEKAGYKYRGEAPGWLSSRYVSEIFMQKTL